MSTLHRTRRILLVALIAWAAQATTAKAALLGLQPLDGIAVNGSSVSLDLVVSGLGDFGPDSLGAFDVSVNYDNTALSFSGYTLGGFLGNLALFEAIDAGAGDTGGSVNVAEVSLLSLAGLHALQPGEFVLASLNFDVIGLAAGASTQLSIAGAAVLADAGGFALPVTTGPGATISGAVPVAGTLLLMLPGLYGLRMVRRKQRRGVQVA